MSFNKKIESLRLRELIKDCSYCKEKADLVGTGKMYHRNWDVGFTNIKNWMIEYSCSVCNNRFKSHYLCDEEIIEIILIEQGIWIKKRYFTVGIRPVFVIERVNRSSVYVFNWEKGGFIQDQSYYDRIYFGPKTDETEELTKAQFEVCVNEIRTRKGF